MCHCRNRKAHLEAGHAQAARWRNVAGLVHHDQRTLMVIIEVAGCHHRHRHDFSHGHFGVVFHWLEKGLGQIVKDGIYRYNIFVIHGELFLSDGVARPYSAMEITG